MILYPRSKINLGLRIVEKRDDGYHNLESLFCDLTNPCDILEIVESDNLSLSLYGEGLDCNLNDNICVKAFNLLKDDFNLPGAEIHLYKKIPSGSGLGGGSSDGAATLIILNRLYNLNIGFEELCAMSAKLGSDCPFFIHSNSSKEGEITTILAKGRGEILEPIGITLLKDYKVKLVNPDIFISTAEAYKGIVPKKPSVPIEEILQMPVEMWRDNLYNDFEYHIFKKYPQLKRYKEELYSEGAVYASMSGSGSTLYGLFKD